MGKNMGGFREKNKNMWGGGRPQKICRGVPGKNKGGSPKEMQGVSEKNEIHGGGGSVKKKKIWWNTSTRGNF